MLKAPILIGAFLLLKSNKMYVSSWVFISIVSVLPFLLFLANRIFDNIQKN